MKELYLDPKSDRYKWRDKQPDSKPPVRVQRSVLRRRCGIFRDVLSVSYTHLTLPTTSRV